MREVSSFPRRFRPPRAPARLSPTATAGSSCLILRVSEEGGGMGPKLLLSLSIFQSPEKFGLSAATARDARAATSRTKVVIFFIARKSPENVLVFVEHENDVELLIHRRDVVIDGH